MVAMLQSPGTNSVPVLQHAANMVVVLSVISCVRYNLARHTFKQLWVSPCCAMPSLCGDPSQGMQLSWQVHQIPYHSCSISHRLQPHAWYHSESHVADCFNTGTLSLGCNRIAKMLGLKHV